MAGDVLGVFDMLIMRGPVLRALVNTGPLIVCAFLISFSSPAVGRTWYVEKDGSGDYTVIQDALDAAASGDTIRIGPGRFEDFRIYPTNGGDRAIIAKINVPTMTIIGAGQDETIIGPTEYFWADPLPPTRGVHLIAQPTSGGLFVERVTIENLVAGVYVENAGPLAVADCAIRGGLYGINSFVSTTVVNSECIGCYVGIWIKSPGIAGVVAGCDFVDIESQGISFQSLEAGTATDCTFIACHDCNTVGIGFSGSGGGVYDCNFSGLLRPISMSSAAYPEVLRNRIYTAGTALYSNSEAIIVEDNIFESTGSGSVIQLYSRGLPHTIRGNHILRRTGLAVEILNHTGPADYHLDMTNNWWGTTDPDSISAWIHDGNDVMWPPGGLVECTVDFDPFADAPIPTKRTSLGGLKGLYR